MLGPLVGRTYKSSIGLSFWFGFLSKFVFPLKGEVANYNTYYVKLLEGIKN